MIDIHTHILPGIDDGPETLEEARSMLEMAASDGTKVMVATPHANARYRFDSELCRKTAEDLRAGAPAGLRICSGCEVHLTPENIEAVLRSPASYTLAGGDCLLLELPDQVLPGTVMPAIEALWNAGLRVIVAHPERNLYVQRDVAFAAELVSSGCYGQLNAGSLAGAFGPGVQASAEHLLRSRLVHFVASDGHRPERRRPLLSAACATISAGYGEAVAGLLFRDNPNAAINGMAIQPMPRPASWVSRVFMRSSDAIRNKQITTQLPSLRR